MHDNLLVRLRAFASKICGLFASRRLDNDFHEEIESHLAMLTEDNMRNGMDPAEARRAARLKLGGPVQLREAHHEQRTFAWLESLWQDVRFAARMLRKNPGFTVTLLLILAIGIGGATAMYTVVRGVLLRPLPFPHSEQLTRVGGITYIEQVDRLEYWAHNAAFDQLAEYRAGGANLTVGNNTDRVSAAIVSASFFPILGISPEMGRTFLPSEEAAGKNHVAVLSHAFWVANLGADRAVLGKTIRLNDTLHTVIGVMPRTFDFPPQTDVWVPRVPRNGAGQLEISGNPVAFGMNHADFGRLKAGVSIAQASQIMLALSKRLQQQYGDAHHYVSSSIMPVVPLQEAIVGKQRLPLITLLIAVLFLLLIVCANAANMLLARAALRQKEVAVRLSLGATRFRIVRQLVTESLLLTLGAGALGVVCARWFLEAIRAIAPPDIPRLADVTIDFNVLVLAFLIAALTGIAVGVAPALEALAPQLTRALKQEGYRSTGTMHRLTRSSLIVGEIAISLVLLSGAALTIQSLYRMVETPLGFNPNNVLTMDLSLTQPDATGDSSSVQSKNSNAQETSSSKSSKASQSGVESNEARAKVRIATSLFYQQLLARIRLIPGVIAVGDAEAIPLTQFGGGDLYFEAKGMPGAEARVFNVGGDYFQAMGIPLVRGRTFTSSELANGGQIVIVNENLARAYWPNDSALGQHIKIEQGDRPWDHEIIGVAGDLSTLDIGAMKNFTFYFPSQGRFGVTVIARTGPAPQTMIGPIRDQILSMNREVSVYNARTLDSVVSSFTAPPRFRAILFGLFAGMAFGLAAFGVYGSMTYSVACRTHEIGVRIAMGAHSRQVAGLVLGEGMRLALAGAALGIILSLALGRLLQSLLFGIRSSDPLSMTLSVAVLFAAAFAATYIPARRATRVDPMEALRYE